MNRKNTDPMPSANPMTNNSQTQVEQAIVLARLHLYNRAMPCGAVALRQYLAEYDGRTPLPSVRKIGIILNQYGLSHQRTGWYEGENLEWLPKSTSIPACERKEVVRS